MQKSAEAATASMFPWERRQMDGSRKPLTTFEKAYWAVFAGALVYLVVTNVRRYYWPKKEPQVVAGALYTHVSVVPGHCALLRALWASCLPCCLAGALQAVGAGSVVADITHVSALQV